jgi:hypothetical protein
MYERTHGTLTHCALLNWVFKVFGVLNKDMETARAAMGDDEEEVEPERLHRFRRAELAYKTAEQDFLDTHSSDKHSLAKSLSQLEEQGSMIGQKFGVVRERTTQSGESEWVDRYVVLSGSSLKVLLNQNAKLNQPLRCLELDQSSVVSRTILQPFAFQVVAPKRRGFTRSTVSDAVAHFEAGSVEERDEWINAIEKSIADAQPRVVNTFEQGALQLQDEMIKISFAGGGEGAGVKLGFKLAPRQQWAVVISVSEDDKHGTRQGSILHNINGTSAMFLTYDQCVDLVSQAKRSSPVELQFRCALQRAGKMRKAPMRKGVFGGWKDRHFVLAEGRLEWFTKEGGQSKGDISLENCTVEEVTGGNKPNLLMIKTGKGEELLLQASSPEEVVGWGAAIMRAAWVATGGQQILDNEVRTLTTRALDCHVRAVGAQSKTTADGAGNLRATEVEVQQADENLALHLGFLKERAAHIKKHEAQQQAAALLRSLSPK